MNLNLILSKIGISTQLTQDVTLIIFIALASFIYGMLLGRHRLMNLLANIYISFALVKVIPEALASGYVNKPIIFFALIIIFTLLSKRFFEVSLTGMGSNNLWRVFSMSFLQIALILSIAFSLIPQKDALGYISANAYNYLVVGWSPLVWMALPLIFVFFFHRRSRY